MSAESIVRTGMRPFGELTSFAEAQRTALELGSVELGATEMSLQKARGRVLSAEVRSPIDVPATDRSAMDGFAVKSADVCGATAEAPVSLRAEGRILAGNLDESVLESGACIEVATGARLPHGSDTVVPVEHTSTDGGRVLILRGGPPGDHVSRQAEDLAIGQVVAAAGDILTPGIAGALASVGVESVDVVRRPRVLLVSTGDELVPLGTRLRPGEVYDSNSVALQSLAEANGAVVERAGIVRDTPEALVKGLQRAEVDLVVTLGGTSVGRHDLVLDIVRSMGEILVHGVALKPGKPVLLARVGPTPVVGLPGFPTSCLITGYLFVEPIIRRMAGVPLDHRRRVAARLDGDVQSPAAKRQFLTVRFDAGKATPVFRTSSAMTSTSAAHGWIEIDEATTRLEAGSAVEVTLF